REIEVAVDRRHQQRTGVIRRAHLIDVGAAVDQRERGLLESFTRREQQRRESALRADEIRVPERFRFAAGIAVRSTARRGTRRAWRPWRRYRGRFRGGELLLDGGDARVALPALDAVLLIARADVDDLRRCAYVGAAGEQNLHDVGAARRRREHERRLSP